MAVCKVFRPWSVAGVTSYYGGTRSTLPTHGLSRNFTAVHVIKPVHNFLQMIYEQVLPAHPSQSTLPSQSEATLVCNPPTTFITSGMPVDGSGDCFVGRSDESHSCFSAHPTTLVDDGSGDATILYLNGKSSHLLVRKCLLNLKYTWYLVWHISNMFIICCLYASFILQPVVDCQGQPCLGDFVPEPLDLSIRVDDVSSLKAVPTPK